MHLSVSVRLSVYLYMSFCLSGGLKQNKKTMTKFIKFTKKNKKLFIPNNKYVLIKICPHYSFTKGHFSVVQSPLKLNLSEFVGFLF